MGLQLETMNISEYLFFKDIEKKYPFSLTDLYIDNLVKLIEELDDGNLHIYKFTNSFTLYHYDNGNYHIIFNKDTLREKLAIDIYASSYENLDNAYNRIKHLINFNDPDVKVFYDSFYYKGGKVETNRRIFKDEDFNVEKEYYPFIDVDKFFNAFIKSNSNILILAGGYGIGKSKFTQLLLKLAKNNIDLFDKEDIYCAYIKDSNVLGLGELWNKLTGYNFVVFDDLEFSLIAPRDKTREDVDKNNFLSNLLSFSDGVIKNNTKIILTTNQEVSDIDQALLREGRLFGIYEFRPLTYEEAKAIWNKHIKDEELPYEDFYTQAKLAKLINDKKKGINKVDDFILDKSIDILYKTKERKTGFV